MGERKMTGAKTYAEQWKEHEESLEEYKNIHGLVSSHNSEVTTILTYNRQQLNALAAEDCGECAFILSQYASYLQQEYNMQKVKYKWANNKLNIYVAKVKSNYGFGKFTKWEEAKSTVVASEIPATILDDTIQESYSRMTLIEDTVRNINTMSQHLKELQQTKRYRK